MRNPFAADYTPVHTFTDIKFVNVTTENLVWIEKPNPAWAAVDPTTDPKNCGNWPCTAPENIVLKFESTTYEGSGYTGEAEFQITSGYEGVASAFDTCEHRNDWQAYHC